MSFFSDAIMMHQDTDITAMQILVFITTIVHILPIHTEFLHEMVKSRISPTSLR